MKKALTPNKICRRGLVKIGNESYNVEGGYLKLTKKSRDSQLQLNVLFHRALRAKDNSNRLYRKERRASPAGLYRKERRASPAGLYRKERRASPAGLYRKERRASPTGLYERIQKL